MEKRVLVGTNEKTSGGMRKGPGIDRKTRLLGWRRN